ncbi:MAG: PHB depolymerase family esterase [Pseudomonadota bacterium]|nr:PHB depolymerase family esterase [Pseudomonadota bacterium]
MKIHRIIPIPFLLLFMLISCGNEETGFVEERVIEHEGLERSFLIYVPTNIKENAPLVVAIHGYTSSAKTLMGYSGINQVADKEGFLVAYPQGTKDSRDNNFFNVGYEFHSDSKVNDVNFIREIVLNLTKDYKLNSKRVFATGMSNGGDMSYLLACTSSDLFTAVAPVAGVMMKDTLENCNPEKKIPIFEIHGTKDSISKFEGDMNNEDKWGAYYDLPSTIEFWVNKHALSEKETIQLENKNTEDGTTITFERYWSDESQREVWFYIVNDGNHTWPGMTGLFSRTANQDINSAEEIWKFFSKF